LRNEDLAIQAAYEKRKESKKTSLPTDRQRRQQKKSQNLQPSLEEAYDFFTKVDWGPENGVKSHIVHKLREKLIHVFRQNSKETLSHKKVKLRVWKQL